MANQHLDPEAAVQAKVENIVSQGQDVRNQVSQVVTDKAGQFHQNPKGLVALTRSVMDGATAALDKAVPQNSESVLRQVVDGLGDGLSTAALAARLAFEEGQAQAKSFAEEDLAKMGKDLNALSDQFADSVADTARHLKSLTAAELGALRTHAEGTMKRLLPSLRLTLAAIAEHPLQFGKESVEAGVSLSRQALGALFAAVGHSMTAASKRLSTDKAGR